MGKREGTGCADGKWKDLEDRRHKLAGRKVSSCCLGYSLFKVGWSGHQTGIMQDQQPPDMCGWSSLPAVGAFITGDSSSQLSLAWCCPVLIIPSHLSASVFPSRRDSPISSTGLLSKRIKRSKEYFEMQILCSLVLMSPKRSPDISKSSTYP